MDKRKPTNPGGRLLTPVALSLSVIDRDVVADAIPLNARFTWPSLQLNVKNVVLPLAHAAFAARRSLGRFFGFRDKADNLFVFSAAFTR